VLYAASVYFLLQSMSALGIIDRSIYGEWFGKTGDKITLTLNLLSIFTNVLLFLWGITKIKVGRFNRFLPLAIASLLLISVLWSVDPRVTLSQGTTYFFAVLGAMGLAEALDSDALMDLLTWVCAISAVASVVQFLIFPEPADYLDFRGIFPQKNVLGEVMAVGVLTALHGIRIGGGRRFRNICIIALCTMVAFMSKSTTSLMAIIIFVWLDFLGRLYLRRDFGRMVSICLVIGSIPIVVVMVMNQDSILDFLGKDPTLSGRTLIWPYVIDNISEKPVLGWGFAAFWSPLNPASIQIADAIRGDSWYIWLIPQAHNGMLELLLEIGFVGTSFFIFLWIRNFVMAMKCITKCINGPARQFGLSSVLLLVGILIVGVSETVLLAAWQIWTILFFIMGFICEKNLWLARAAWGREMAMSAAGHSLPPRASHRLRLRQRRL
jgi:exopolysaccharide production protein ExoQ